MKPIKKIPATMLTLTMLAIVLTACSTDSTQNITFPAYQYEVTDTQIYYESINNTPPFTLNVDLPNGWELRTPTGTVTHSPNDIYVPGNQDETGSPPGEFYTTVNMYDGDKFMGYIGFNQFEPYTDEIAQEEYYKTVYPSLRLSSFFVWDPYTAVKTTDTTETGIADISYKDPKEIDNHPGAMPDVPVLETSGILSYDKELKVYIGIAFCPNTVDRDQVETIAQSISLQKKS